MSLIYIRQFTTFKTKAGTELYQDDIIQLSNNEGKTFIGNINWSDRRGCYEVIARYKSKEYNRLWLDQVTAHNAIHLGNIYENLDLLRN
ncbi:hypothetical protein ABF234_001352 [Flavobacterium psychrophilum]|nr:hypothetical protein [Flavobacterium psychrophilum]